MKTIEELTTYFRTARSFAKIGDDSNKNIVIGSIEAISTHCKELYEISSVMDKVKCKVQYENLDRIISIISTNGLNDYRVKAFFGLAVSSSEAPSFSDIMSGKGYNMSGSAGAKADTGSAKGCDSVDNKSAGNKPDENGSANSGSDTGDDIIVVPPVRETPVKPDNLVPRSDKSGGLLAPTGSFAPESLADFIGQEHVVKRIKAEISAAKKQGLKHIDHILLFGNRGLGKSTLMKLIAKELGVRFEFMDASQMGNDVRSQRAVQKFLQRISRDGEPVVIAFDEIHALPKHIQTALLTLLNDRVYTYMDENGVNHSLPIEEFTFIGATTDAQDVLSTIKDRCNNLTFYLKDYTREELAKIFVNKFAAKGLSVKENVLTMCIDRCRSSIREVDAFVNGLKTKAINADVNTVNVEMATEYFKDIDRDPIGLKTKDLEILNHLLNEPTGVMSEDTLAARVHMDAKVLTKEFEPYLLKIGFVNISSRGRSLTQKAINYLTTGSVDGKKDGESAPEDVAIDAAPQTPENKGRSAQDAAVTQGESTQHKNDAQENSGDILDDAFGGDDN